MRSPWELLKNRHSITAIYYLGEYAAAEGNQILASKYRYQFLQLDDKSRNKKGDEIFWGFPGQYFCGILPDIIE